MPYTEFSNSLQIQVPVDDAARVIEFDPNLF